LKLEDIIRQTKPQFVFTHSYEGGHPDHDSTAFAVHAACRLLQKQHNTSPIIIEFALYNNFPGYFVMNKFIPYNLTEKLVELNDFEMKYKKDLLSFFTSQQYLLKNYDSHVESYRIAPVYDFSKPPHEGKIHYDNFDWGIKNEEWREIANDTLEMFNL
jgi:LmbE family N-acetylglucosaminyl deacetylase